MLTTSQLDTLSDAQASFDADLADYLEASPFTVSAVNLRTRMLALRAALLDCDDTSVKVLEAL